MSKKRKCPICKQRKRKTLFVKMTTLADETRMLIYIRTCEKCFKKKKMLLPVNEKYYRSLKENLPVDMYDQLFEELEKHDA